jgi:hypothetical protein
MLSKNAPNKFSWFRMKSCVGMLWKAMGDMVLTKLHVIPPLIEGLGVKCVVV